MECEVIVTIDGRDALPVRAIPFITGWELPPDELARQLARRIGAPFEKLPNTFAFRLDGGAILKMLPKQWDATVARMEALEPPLRSQTKNQAAAYLEWRDTSVAQLPAGVFIWFDEFQSDSPFGKEPIDGQRPGDRELLLKPGLNDIERNIVFEGFSQVLPVMQTEPIRAIDWSYWRRLSQVQVPVRDVIALSINMDPHNEEIDVDELLSDHPEAKKRLRLLLNNLSDTNYFSPPTLNAGDPSKTRIVLSEFSAWWIQTQLPNFIPEGLADIGRPLVYERQTNEKHRKGRYTLEEAAEMLKKHAGERAKPMQEKLCRAAFAGLLPVFRPGENARHEYVERSSGTSQVVNLPSSLMPGGVTHVVTNWQQCVKPFYEEAYWNDLNAWLEANEPRIDWRFPDPAPNEPVESKSSDTPSSSDRVVQSNNEVIPGKHPRTSVGKLAIEAAWKIEQDTKRGASSKQVIEQLQEWADAGSHPDVLITSDKSKRGVEWRTLDGKLKWFDIEACGKALAKWFNSRA